MDEDFLHGVTLSLTEWPWDTRRRLSDPRMQYNTFITTRGRGVSGASVNLAARFFYKRGGGGEVF